MGARTARRLLWACAALLAAMVHCRELMEEQDRPKKPAAPGKVTMDAVVTALSEPATELRRGFFPVTYYGCQQIINMSDIKEACGHLINPSGLVYQPTYKRLYIIGQEYVIHFRETEDENDRYLYKVQGCYKGANFSLGRGDGEAATGLDFDLPVPPRENTRQRRNWAQLKKYDNFIMMMEENFHEPVIYLINTRKLGVGYQESENATLHKFYIPPEYYPEKIEGMAFVPDLTDSLYLGTVFMGTQRNTIHTCKLPLTNFSKPVVCSDKVADFQVKIDMMEYDPTYKIKEGQYGALAVGSEMNNAAVFVDPYLVAQGQSNDVTLSLPFDLVRGAVDDLELLKGIEGMQIYGNRIFLALDRNKMTTNTTNTTSATLEKVQGAVMCYLTKQASWATETHGWHSNGTGPMLEAELEQQPLEEHIPEACKYCLYYSANCKFCDGLADLLEQPVDLPGGVKGTKYPDWENINLDEYLPAQLQAQAESGLKKKPKSSSASSSSSSSSSS